MRTYWLIILVALSPTVLLAQANKPRVEKEPLWVTLKSVDYSDKKLDKQAESGFVNLDFEKQVSLQQKAIYFKRAIRIISESGVQNSSEVNVDYDPAYNQLVFHSIRIIRGTTSINKLQLSKIKTIQQESELNRHLYDGSLSAVLFLDDVRKGDIIEYSYTIKGFNPVFKGKFSETLDAAFSIPVYNMYYKVLVPKGRTIQVKTQLTDAVPAISQAGAETVYEWRFDHVPPVHPQDRLPSWYDPYAVIMISEYQNWKEVNDWALTLFPFSAKPSPILQKKIDEIKSANSTPDTKVLAALRFVQDDIRYLGIEMGENSHRPNTPDKVCKQRFGDCKDKSYLLCTILRGLDINAWPVLINTSSKKSIAGWLPAAASFDHTTVRALVNGRYYWFDPTIRFQRGALSNISYPNYQCGLVISDTTTGLTMIPKQDEGMVDVKEEFTIADLSGKVRLKVQTTYSGSEADNARDDFESNSVFEMQKTYKDFYGAFYEDINADSLDYSDDEKTGKFTTIEFYTIDDFWTSEEGYKKGYFSPYVISSYLKKPKDEKRTMPFSISYPAKYREEIIIKVPEDWPAEESLDEYNCAAFKLRVQYSYQSRKYRLRYEYESLKDNVMPNEAASYMKNYAQADANISYYLNVPESSIIKAEKKPEVKPDKKPDSIVKGFKGIIAFVCLLLIALVIFMTRLRR